MTLSDETKQICEMLTSAVRPSSERKVGIEIERIGLWPDGTPLSYSGGKDSQGRLRPGAEQLLAKLSETYGWSTVKNAKGNLMGLEGDFGKVSLEPGSQVELAARATSSLSEMKEMVDHFEDRVNTVTKNWGLRWICMGLNPLVDVDSVEVIPSPRYHIMTDYLGQRSSLGTRMMRLTSSVQVNLDYTSESEAIEMLRTALAVAPISYALFANSPVYQKQNSDFLSFRQEIWRNTDPDRCGLLPEAFEEGFNFQKYAEIAQNTPLMFAQNTEGEYVPSLGKSLHEIAEGALPGVEADAANLRNSIQQLFFEARIKPGYIEVRSVDGQCPQERYAATAFWYGLLYQPEARKTALELLGGLTPEQRQELFLECGKKGLLAEIHGINVRQVTQTLADLAQSCLASHREEEARLMTPIFRMLKSGQNPAARRMERFYRSWDGSPEALIEMAGHG